MGEERVAQRVQGVSCCAGRAYHRPAFLFSSVARCLVGCRGAHAARAQLTDYMMNRRASVRKTELWRTRVLTCKMRGHTVTRGRNSRPSAGRQRNLSSRGGDCLQHRLFCFADVRALSDRQNLRSGADAYGAGTTFADGFEDTGGSEDAAEILVGHDTPTDLAVVRGRPPMANAHRTFTRTSVHSM